MTTVLSCYAKVNCSHFVNQESKSTPGNRDSSKKKRDHVKHIGRTLESSYLRVHHLYSTFGITHGAGCTSHFLPEARISTKQQFSAPPGREEHPLKPHVPQEARQQTSFLHTDGIGEGELVVEGVAEEVEDADGVAEEETDTLTDAVVDGKADGVTGIDIDGEGNLHPRRKRRGRAVACMNRTARVQKKTK